MNMLLYVEEWYNRRTSSLEECEVFVVVSGTREECVDQIAGELADLSEDNPSRRLIYCVSDPDAVTLSEIRHLERKLRDERILKTQEEAKQREAANHTHQREKRLAQYKELKKEFEPEGGMKQEDE